MLNGYDRINVRLGNQRRKRALQRAAAARGSAGIGGSVGGGLGRSRANQARFPLLRGKLGDLLGQGMGQGQGRIGEFDPAEFQPGAPDPGTGFQGGGVSDPGGMAGVPNLRPNQWAGISAGDPLDQGTQTQEQLNQSVASAYPDGTPAQVAGAAGPMVWYQGQLIPSGVYQAIVRGGGF